VPLLWRGLQPGVLQGFEAMNRALKQRVEGGGRAAPVGVGAGDLR